MLSTNMSKEILLLHSARQINSVTLASKKDNLIKTQWERKLILGQGEKTNEPFVRKYLDYHFQYRVIK